MSEAEEKSEEKSEREEGAAKKPTFRIGADGPWANAWKVSAVFGVVGLAASVFGMLNDPHRFAFSWLFAFMTFLALGLGGLFFVLGQHLTGAGWGVTMRRTSEFLMMGLPVFVLLFAPIAMNMGELYPWMHHAHGEEHHEAEGEHGEDEHGEEAEGEEAHGDEHGALGLGSSVARAQDTREAHDVPPGHGDLDVAHAEGAEEAHHNPNHAEHEHIIEKKLGYLNQGFFLARALVYFAAWILLAFLFFNWSTRQDKEKGLELTKKMQRFAPPATFIFGLSLTFAAFDWMMSMEPSWYSTIFGVQYFAVSAVIGHAVIILITMGLRRAGLLGDAVNVEHYHDVGKLLFGFIVFWAYISFSQFMLIWYAGIPEEATYYHLRWWGGGGFLTLSVVMVIAHFVIPFFLLISRNTKRRLPVLAFAAIWVVVMHIVELYWLVMPYAEQTGIVSTSMRLHWMDFAALFAVGGIYMSFVLWLMTRHPLVPVGDPRLSRALHFENV
ncbi:MAG TPA: hypothetical protein RMH99_31900 [Sandaracinaceae bacterium LLY-WYZ-13_1]|nr:hypothetical protein [Sandaracinaceae bacterium LLY-WYZ-13_1]